MSSQVQQVEYQSNTAYKLENDELSVILIPEIGGKLVSITDKRANKEWLVDSGERTLKRIAPDTRFIDADMSGWDECFPSVKPCTVDGIAIGDHGDIWNVVWEVQQESDGLRCVATHPQNHYRFSRHLTLERNKLTFNYEVTNLMDRELPFIWLPHPQFSLSEPVELLLPSSIQELYCVYHTNQALVQKTITPPETWIIEASNNKAGEKYYSQRLEKGARYGLHGLHSKSRLSVQVDHDVFLAIWIDYALFNEQPTIALEPSIGYYDLLTRAIENGTAPKIAPKQCYTWKLEIEVESEPQSV
jgi:galactose mutarotase-like enzyme